MKISRKLMLAASALTITGALGVAGGTVSAVTDHCDTTQFPNKVELDGSSATYDTGLPAGTLVCIKAGTETVNVVVGADGTISTEGLIVNRNGNGRGISYFAYGEVCTDPYGCEPTSS
jgi:hypothetical protein